MKWIVNFVLAAIVCFVGGCGAVEMVSNPVAPWGNDPWVVKDGDTYYYCSSGRGGVRVNSSNDMVDVLQSGGSVVWRPERGKDYSRELWAPELHKIDGKWYIYVAADDGRNENHRMYALRAKTDDPCGEFELLGKVTDDTDKWAIDATVLQHKGKLYFIWSGWEGDSDGRQDLYIAEMSDPATICSKRVLISTPEYGWEKRDTPLINEGPEVLKNKSGDVFVIYSASGSWGDNYCLGQLKLVGDDPLKADSWQKKPEAVFVGTDKVFAPGHASFTKSPDGSEDWIVYHTAREQGSGWHRDANIKKFSWDKEGNPAFGKPLDKGIEFARPSGSVVIK